MATMKKTEMPILQYSGFPSRYICTIFDEMRDCHKHYNFSYLPSLIEEAQLLANRMEAHLDDVKDRKTLRSDISKLKEARSALKKEVQGLIDNRDSIE